MIIRNNLSRFPKPVYKETMAIVTTFRKKKLPKFSLITEYISNLDIYQLY